MSGARLVFYGPPKGPMSMQTPVDPMSADLHEVDLDLGVGVGRIDVTKLWKADKVALRKVEAAICNAMKIASAEGVDGLRAQLRELLGVSDADGT